MLLLALGLPAAEPPEIAQIAEGVYARVVSPDGNAVANSGFVVLEHSVVVFDTHFTPEAGRNCAPPFARSPIGRYATW